MFVWAEALDVICQALLLLIRGKKALLPVWNV